VKVINASRGPALVNEPTRYKSNPLLDILLGKRLDMCIRNEKYMQTYLISAELKVRIASSTRCWAIGPATAPIKYNAVSSTYDMVSNSHPDEVKEYTFTGTACCSKARSVAS